MKRFSSAEMETLVAQLVLRERAHSMQITYLSDRVNELARRLEGLENDVYEHMDGPIGH